MGNLIMPDSSKIILVSTSQNIYLKLNRLTFGVNCQIICNGVKGRNGQNGREPQSYFKRVIFAVYSSGNQCSCRRQICFIFKRAAKLEISFKSSMNFGSTFGLSWLRSDWIRWGRELVDQCKKIWRELQGLYSIEIGGEGCFNYAASRRPVTLIGKSEDSELSSCFKYYNLLRFL